jgi:hypothetical protein
MKQYESIEEALEDVMNSKVTISMRITWLFKDMYRKAKTAVRTPKWWCQRVTRGYSDKDMWNADMYLAGIFAGVLDWYIHNARGVPMVYADPEDPYCTDMEAMIIKRNAEYLNHIAIFREYLKNGYAMSDNWKEEYGGVLDKDIKDSVHWLADHFIELWD